jgi:hypothetical protein
MRRKKYWRGRGLSPFLYWKICSLCCHRLWQISTIKKSVRRILQYVYHLILQWNLITHLTQRVWVRCNSGWVVTEPKRVSTLFPGSQVSRRGFPIQISSVWERCNFGGHKSNRRYVDLDMSSRVVPVGLERSEWNVQWWNFECKNLFFFCENLWPQS